MMIRTIIHRSGVGIVFILLLCCSCCHNNHDTRSKNGNLLTQEHNKEQTQEQNGEMPDTSGYGNSFVMVPKPEFVDKDKVTFWNDTHELFEYASANAFYVIKDTICAFEATCFHDESGFQLFILTQSDFIKKYTISSIDSQRIVYHTDKGKQTLMINQYETEDLEEHQKQWVWERIFNPKAPQHYQTAEPIEQPDNQ